MQLFPPEILSHTTEVHYSRTHSKTWIVYLIVLVVVATVIVSLPFISVSVSTQSRGIIRTEFENNLLQSAVYAQVIDIRITENQPVVQGDTLLVLNSDNINVQINRLQERINENNLFLASGNEHQTRIAFLKHELSVSERLHQRDAIAQNEYLRDRNNYDNPLRSLDNLREQFRNRWQAERTTYEQEILILDEATSSLDSESESFVQKTIQKLKSEGKTIVIIAHRLSTVVNADKIIVMEEGKVIEEGKHKELFDKKGRDWEM
jgi:ABC-type multidrug transport system fused ATPase/permease subunit